ncbi:MAG: hypothetical protein AB1762_03895 [Gemmatimonadota bacterium]
MTMRAPRFGLLFISLACGGSGGPPAPAPVTFSGTYSTRVTLAQSTCGTVVVQDNPTVVTHNATTQAVTLTHAGITYSGTVQADSSFSTEPRPVEVNDGSQYIIQISGRFRVRAFEADATVDRARQGATCRYVVRLVGALR